MSPFGIHTAPGNDAQIHTRFFFFFDFVFIKVKSRRKKSKNIGKITSKKKPVFFFVVVFGGEMDKCPEVAGLH